jgi:hypothetical protein
MDGRCTEHPYCSCRCGPIAGVEEVKAALGGKGSSGNLREKFAKGVEGGWKAVWCLSSDASAARGWRYDRKQQCSGTVKEGGNAVRATGIV